MSEPGRQPAPDSDPVRSWESLTAGAGADRPVWFWSVRDRAREDEVSRRARALLAQGAGASLLVASAPGHPAA